MRFLILLLFFSLSLPVSASYAPTTPSRVITKSSYTEGKSAKSYQLKRLINLVQKKANEADSDLVFLIILCVLLPFIAVLLKEGRATSRFWISLLLTALFWLPGVIYSLLVVLHNNK